MKTKTDNKGISVVIILLFVALVLAGAFYFVWKNLSPTQPANIPLGESPLPVASPLPASKTPVPSTPTPKPTIYPLIPDSGSAGTYNVSQGAHSGPSVTRVVFDPLDVKKGQELKVTVTLQSASGASNVSAVFTMDSSSTNLNFQKVSSSGGNETWEVKFTLTDSVNYKYILNLTAKDASGTNNITVAPRS